MMVMLGMVFSLFFYDGDNDGGNANGVDDSGDGYGCDGNVTDNKNIVIVGLVAVTILLMLLSNLLLMMLTILMMNMRIITVILIAMIMVMIISTNIGNT